MPSFRGVCVSVGMRLMPGPGGFDNRFWRLILGGPAKYRVCQ